MGIYRSYLWLHYIKVVRSALTQTVLPLINQPEMIGYLKLCVWKIHGYKSRQLGNKLLSADFLNIIKDQDHIGLTEPTFTTIFWNI